MTAFLCICVALAVAFSLPLLIMVWVKWIQMLCRMFHLED